MNRCFSIALIGDYDPTVIAHQAIPEALRLAAAERHLDVEAVWIHTSTIHDPATQLKGFQGIWCVPASPYANTEGALSAIRYAREAGRPFLGTCGGFQHALIEFARNVCGLENAEHSELNPGAPVCLIAPLTCSLVEQSEELTLVAGTKILEAYGTSHIREGYHCSYGLNREYEGVVFRDGLRPAAHGSSGEVRAIELEGHPFFVGTLFQPERRALRGETPPLVAAFLSSIEGAFRA